MAGIDLRAPLKKVGNSYAIFIPIDKVREGQLKEGDIVQARLALTAQPALGLLKDLDYRPWGPEDKAYLNANKRT